jgi:hypothetical protein
MTDYTKCGALYCECAIPQTNIPTALRIGMRHD